MTHRLFISREAEADLAEVIEWLADRSPELPARYEADLEHVYSSILDHPEFWPVVYRRFHRALLRKFPYSVFYVVETDAIVVMGVVHQAREESTWKRRA